MTDAVEFGAGDLGGPKNASPSQAVTPDAKLANEQLKKKAWSRYFAAAALIVMSISAVTCLGFSFYVGCHFLEVLEHQDKKGTVEYILSVNGPVSSSVSKSISSEALAVSAEASQPSSKPAAETDSTYLKLLAPVIPASFSSALAIILFITIARFVTNYERAGRDSEDNTPEDYGAIAVLVQEIGKLIQTLRGR